MKPTIRIAIDGFSKCGKSTLAKALAEKFDLLYIDSGALYRLTALFLPNKQEIRPEDLSFFDHVDMARNGAISCLGKDYTREIGSTAVNRTVSAVAQNALVRSAVNTWIRNKSRNASVVMDGRDIGTVVLPSAEIKLYLYASAEYRMGGWRNRQLQLHGFVDPAAAQRELESITKRDLDDLNRSIAPLRCADDALRFDVEQYSLEQIFTIVCRKVWDLQEE